jgi:hypothetical protein
MTRRFECTDAKPNKFWEITVTEKLVTVGALRPHLHHGQNADEEP